MKPLPIIVVVIVLSVGAIFLQRQWKARELSAFKQQIESEQREAQAGRDRAGAAEEAAHQADLQKIRDQGALEAQRDNALIESAGVKLPN
ncbi:MAG: hypothetical protein V4662_25055 [Verrucomicrobiota bacterium]